MKYVSLFALMFSLSLAPSVTFADGVGPQPGTDLPTTEGNPDVNTSKDTKSVPCCKTNPDGSLGCVC